MRRGQGTTDTLTDASQGSTVDLDSFSTVNIRALSDKGSP